MYLSRLRLSIERGSFTHDDIGTTTFIVCDDYAIPGTIKRVLALHKRLTFAIIEWAE